jgi:hypothetical protein
MANVDVLVGWSSRREVCGFGEVQLVKPMLAT